MRWKLIKSAGDIIIRENKTTDRPTKPTDKYLMINTTVHHILSEFIKCIELSGDFNG